MKKDKARDIARGVLPSTARKGARDNKRNFHSKNRAAQRRTNHAISRHLATVGEGGTLAHDPDLYDDFVDPDIFDGYAAATKAPSIDWEGSMDYIVSRRREADKLGPLIAWATATEKNKMVGWDNVDKIAYFKAVLPDSLQGRHALGHVKDALGLRDDEFSTFAWRYPRPEPKTRSDVYNGVTRLLSNSKSRAALREFLYETVPVATHAVAANNKRRSLTQAYDENGEPRFVGPEEWDVSIGRMIRYLTPRPLMVDVYEPQFVTTSCDVCTFLRNDPLATPEAVGRFVDIVWENVPRFNRYGRYVRPKNNRPDDHRYITKIFDHVVASR